MTVSITCSINIGTTAILVCGRKSVTYACRIYEPWNWVPVLSRWPIQTFRKQGRLFHFFAHHALLESAIALHTSGRQMSETKHLLVLDISYLKAPQQHTLCEAQHATVSETCWASCQHSTLSLSLGLSRRGANDNNLKPLMHAHLCMLEFS